MPLDLDVWESNFTVGGVEDEKEDLVDNQDNYYYGKRGTMGDVVSLVGRAGISALESIENAAEFFNLNDSEVDTMGKLRNFSIFKPDIDEYYNKGWLKDTPIGSIPSAVESMGPSLLAAGAGFAAGAPFGGPIGGIIGAAIASLGLMGTAEYQQTYELAIEQGLSEDEAHDVATKTGLVEGLGEAAASTIGLFPIGKALTAVAKRPLTATLKTALKASPKAMAKEFAKVYAGEQLTEFGQAGLQAKALKDAGLSDTSSFEAMAKTIIPTLFMTGAFQSGTNAYSARQRKALRNVLQHGTNEEKTKAVEIITKNLAQTDPEISNAWDIYGKMTIAKGKDIDWNQDFAQFAEELQIAHAQPITNEMILTGKGLNEAVANRLETVSVQPIPTEWTKYEEYEPDLPKGYEERAFDEQLAKYEPELPVGYDGRVKAEEEAKAVEQEKIAKARAHLEKRLAKFAEPKTPAQAEAKAAIEEAIQNLVIEGGEGAVGVTQAPSNEEVVSEQGLREIPEFTESREERGKPDIRVATPLDWNLDPDLAKPKGQSDGIIGTLPGVEDVSYSIVNTGQDGYLTTRIRQVGERTVKDTLGTFETKEEAVGTVNKDARDFIAEEGAGTEWVGKKGQPRTATFNENTYEIDKVGSVWKVRKNGTLFKNPNNVRGGWGKSLAGVQSTIEKIENVQREEKITPQKPEEVAQTPEEVTQKPKQEQKPTPETTPTFVGRYEGKPFSEQLQKLFRRQLETINGALAEGLETPKLLKRLQKDKKELEAVLKSTKTGEPINIEESVKGAKKIEAEPIVTPIEVGKVERPQPKLPSTETTQNLTPEQAESLQASEGITEEEATPLAEKVADEYFQALPGDEANEGVPTETNGLEIVQRQAEQGDALAQALLAKGNTAALAEIPVTHNPNVNSKYDPNTNEITLKGDESWIKMHEVVHGITYRQMIENPALEAEVASLMDDTQSAGVQLSDYAISTPYEFIAQVQTNPEFIQNMKNAGVGKQNLWNRFVDFVRRVLGLPQSRMTLLDRALDITLRASEVQVGTVEAPAVEAFQGARSRLANREELNKAIELEKQGTPQDIIMFNTGWRKFEDGNWRFFVPDKDTTLTEQGIELMQGFVEIAKGGATEISPVTLLGPDILQADLTWKAYPEMFESLEVEMYFNKQDTNMGNYDPQTHSLGLNIAQLVDPTLPDDLNLNSIRESVVHEIQHMIQYAEGFASGGNIELNSKMNASIIAGLIKRQALERFPGTEFANTTNASLSHDNLNAIVTDKYNDGNLPYIYAYQDAILDVVEDLVKNFPNEMGEIRQGNDPYSQEIIRRLRYEQLLPLVAAGVDKRESSESLIRDMDVQTYFRLLGEIEARLASTFMDSTPEEVADLFDAEKMIEEMESGGTAIVVPGRTYEALGNVKVASEPKQTLEERKTYVAEKQLGGARQMDESLVGYAMRNAKEFAKGILDVGAQLVQPINDALYNINPKLAALSRIRESQHSNNIKTDILKVSGFAEKLKALSDEDKAYFKAGWVNRSDRRLLEDVVKRNGLEEEWKVFRKMLKTHEKELVKWGVLDQSELIEDYIPRVVKDPLALYNALRGEQFTEVQAQLEKEKNKYEKSHGLGSFGKRQREEALGSLFSSGRYKALPLPGLSKSRKVGHVPTEFLQYYADPIEAMYHYIYEINETIFQRSLVGRSNRASQVRKLNAAMKELDKLEKGTERHEKKLLEVMGRRENIKEVDEDTQSTLVNMLEDPGLGLTPEQQMEALKLLRARFAQRGTKGFWHGFKNVSLMMTIGNPLSAITQLGDQGFNIMDNGLYGLRGVAKAIAGTDLVDQFDIQSTLKDFITDSKSTNTLDTLLKWSGLMKMDLVGKESYMQGVMKRLGSMDFKTFTDKVGIYGEFLMGEGSTEEKLGEAYLSMQQGKPSKNALYILFSELSRRQPTTLSETSSGFLQAGNARIFWLLKQFALRAVSSAVQDARMGFQSGTPVKGLMKAVGLIGLLGLAGAGTDEIKNILLGREGEELDDAVISNLMQILFVNRYSVETGLQKGKLFSTLIANNLMLPPVRVADDIVNDVWKTSQGDFSYKTMSNVPMFGRLVFEYTPQGREAELKRQRTYVLDRIADGDSPGKLRAEINRINRAITPDMDIERITSKSIKAAKKRKK